MEAIVIAWVLFSISISLLIGKYFIKNSLKFNFNKSNQNAVRFSSQSKPIYGGVIFFVVFILSVFLSMMISSNDLTVRYLFTFLLTGTIGFLVGLIDDLFSPSPLFKFLGQSIVAFALIYLGVTTKATSSDLFNNFITFFWVLSIMNSINLLDNMDAISSSISITILLSVLGILLMDSNINFPMIIMIAGVIGSLIGFLKYNWNPAQMYMGDNGSQFLGAILAVIGIMFFWNMEVGVKVELSFWKSFWIIIVAFIVPIIDTTTVFINRISKGKSPFVGGRDHTTHHLFYLGLSVKQVALVLGGITFVSLAVAIYAIKFIEHWNILYSCALASYVIILFIIIFSITKISSEPKQ